MPADEPDFDDESLSRRLEVWIQRLFFGGRVLVKKLFLDYKRWETRHGCENTELVGNLLSMVISLELCICLYLVTQSFQFHPMGCPWQAASNHFCQPPQNMHHNPCTCALHRGAATSWLLGQAWKRLILFSRWKQGYLKLGLASPNPDYFLHKLTLECLIRPFLSVSIL